MRESPQRWYRAGPPGTYVHAHEFSGFNAEESYRVATLRRVTHPSLHQILDRAVSATAAADRGGRGDAPSTLYKAARAIPAEHRRAFAERRPEAIIPFVGIAAGVLAPLQLLSEVPCIRFYEETLPGEVAQRMYPPGGLSLKWAPEALLTPALIAEPTLTVRYLDYLWKDDAAWPSSPLVLISNARVRQGAYEEQGRPECERLIRTILELPKPRPGELHATPKLPEWHFDWAISLIMRTALA